MQTNLKVAKESLRQVEDQKMALAFELEAVKKQVHAQAVEIVRLRKLVYQEHQVPRATSLQSPVGMRRPREPLPPGPLDPEEKKKKLAPSSSSQHAPQAEMDDEQVVPEEEEEEKEEDEAGDEVNPYVALVAKPSQAPK